MAISGLINNITGSIAGLGKTLGLVRATSKPGYNQFASDGIEDITSDTKARWFEIPTERYVFSVIKSADDLKLGNSDTAFLKSISSIANIFTNAGEEAGFTDFALPIAPQEIVQTENFATNIRPTQGGTIVQHSVSKYKDLIISGTTGVHPFRGITGVNRLNGAAIFQPDDIKYRSGYEVFIHFRNWIKSYHRTKAEGGVENNKYRMIFKNYKDWEFLIVEPQKFTMKRDATRPLLYNYTINFRVLGHYSVAKPPLGVLGWIDKGLNFVPAILEISRGIFLKRQEFIRSIAGSVDNLSENIRKATLAAKAITGGDILANEVSQRIKSNQLSQRDALELIVQMTPILKNNARGFGKSNPTADPETYPEDSASLAEETEITQKEKNVDFKTALAQLEAKMGDLLKEMGIDGYPPGAIRAILEEQQEAALASKQSFQNLLIEVRDFKDKLASALNLMDENYSKLYNLTTTTEVEVTDNPDIQFETLYAFQQAEAALEIILSSDEFFDTAQSLYSKADSDSGAETIGAGIFSFPDANAGVIEGVVPQGATLEDIAFVELGDASRWTELAELNNLKYPFIDNSAESGKKINYIVKSASYTNPQNIQGLTPNEYYLVAPIPFPVNAWIGRGDQLAQYTGGDILLPDSWIFINPPIGTVVQVLDMQIYLELTDLGWIEIELDEIQSSEVLRPGDVIKIPSSQTGDFQTRIRGPRDNPILNKLPPSQKILAVDLKLNEDGDLELLPSGDLNLSFGADNMAQAIVLKLLYEKGELKKHASIGTQLRVGGKLPDLATVRSQILASLLQDERIRDVKNINLRQNNSTIEIIFDVFLKDLADPIPITIPV